MPEGPSILILKEELLQFRNKKVLEVTGNSKIGIERLLGQKVIDFKSWGKHTLICFKDFFLRIHMLMWGSCYINKKKDAAPRLSMRFGNGEVNFYSCSIKINGGSPDDIYNWSADVLSDSWDAAAAARALKKQKNTLVCDALLNQDIFAGVGNIIKNEVLFRIRINPISLVEAVPAQKIKELVKDARDYSFLFYHWKKAYELKKHWLIYKKKMCPRCDILLVRTYLGQTDRLSFYCNNCQELYTNAKKASKKVSKKPIKKISKKTK
jgi:endonuclease-8